MDVPIIETERLRLRGHCPEDLSECAAMWADPTVTRYIGGKPFSREDVWARMLRYTGHWSWLGFGYWAIEERATGHFLGEVGFADFKRGIESIEGAPEIGWAFAVRAQGNGYATEAVRSALQWGDAQFDRGRTVCMIRPDNMASLRVAARCGYQEFRRTVYKNEETILLARMSDGVW